MTIRISLRRVGSINLEPSGPDILTRLVHQELYGPLTKQQTNTYDVLHNLIERDPKTGAVIDSSLAEIVGPANEFLAAMMNATWMTLENPESFSHEVTKAGSKSVTIQQPEGEVKIPTGLTTRGWGKLTYGYLYKIGAIRKSGPVPAKGTKRETEARAAAKDKTFWYERRRPGSLVGGKKKRQASGGYKRVKLGTTPASTDLGVALGEGAKGILSETAKFLRPHRFQSQEPLVNSFSIANLKSRKARSYGRKATAKQKKGAVVYSTLGELVGPSKLTIDSKLDQYFARITLEALFEGKEHRLSRPGKIYFASYENEWAAIALTNERRRPWIARFWSLGEKLLVPHIHSRLRRYVE